MPNDGYESLQDGKSPCRKTRHREFSMLEIHHEMDSRSTLGHTPRLETRREGRKEEVAETKGRGGKGRRGKGRGGGGKVGEGRSACLK